VAFTGTVLKLTVPLPVDVLIVMLLPKIASLAEANATPDAAPVLMEPFKAIVPVVVTLNEANAVVWPTV
jgi:hypothetical protein